jgi:ABC-type uncharacterized transport system permease subunit
METTSFFIIFGIYLVSLIVYFLNFENPTAPMSYWGQRLIRLGLLLHFISLAVLVLRGPGILISLPESLYAVSFLIVLISYFMEWRYRARYLVLFSLPITLIFSLLALFLSRHSFSVAAPASQWAKIHATLIMVGFASLITAVSSALMYLIQLHQLKARNIGKTLFKLPPLETIDRIHFSSLTWGVILFSFGLLTGIFSAENIGELKHVLKDPKVSLSLVACVFYWMILCFRLSQLRRGQKIAMGTVIVFMFLFVTFLTANYGQYGFHKGL